jgi:hypothetical protein
MLKPIPSGRPSRGIKAIQAVMGLLLVLNLFVLCMSVVALRQNHRQARESAATTAQNLSHVLERDLRGEIQRIDLALFALRQEMMRQRNAGGLQEGAVNAYIVKLFTQFPELSSIRTANAEGRIDHGIGIRPGASFSLADRAYFMEARQNPDSRLNISAPLVGRTSGEWVVILSRRLDLPDGQFAGVAYAAITITQLTRSLSLIDVGSHGTVTLRGADLGIYAKFPPVPSLGNVIGRRDASPTLQDLIRQGQSAGVYTARGGFDGVERTFCYMKVGDLPLILHVGLASEDYLAQWWSLVREYSVFLGFLFLISSGLAWLLQHTLRREQERALDEVKELRGLLPICASCKNVRDDAGYWNQIESYVQAHTAATFTHGICPDCMAKMYPDFPPRSDRND